MTLDNDVVTLQHSTPAGLRLALRRADGGPGADRRPPFLLVHGLASNAWVWDGVTRRLAAAGYDAAAVDLRGHGSSDVPNGGYDTDSAAGDLAVLCAELGWVGERRPVVAGQSWGANVVLALAASAATPLHAIALIDGGWLRLAASFPTFTQCWASLAPPDLSHLRYRDLAERLRAAHRDWPAEGIEGTLANLIELPEGGVRARLDRSHHEQILHSLWACDPRTLYPLVAVPVLLLPAGDPDATHLLGRAKRATVDEAAACLPGAAGVDRPVRWYVGADHDLHAQHPQRVATDLLSLVQSEEVRA